MGISAFSQNIEFIENKGQWDPQVRYVGEVANGAFFIHQNGFTVLQYKDEDMQRMRSSTHGNKGAQNSSVDKNFIVHSHSYRVQFLNAQSKTNLIAEKPLSTYNNYFIGNDPSKWASNCKIYQAVTVKDVYPGIDVHYYSDKGTLKYDIIVKPGTDASQIALKYDGADKMEIKNKELLISTSVGQLKELAPYSYQYNERIGKTEAQVKYSLKNNVVRFNIKNHDAASTLIIDPTLIFSSFSGSTADNWGYTATYGPDGSMYGGGIVFANGFPVSPGAFQQSFNGGDYDIGVIKLSPDGTSRIYATYIGGSDNEQPHSLIVNAQGNLIIAGRSASNNYPTKGAVGTKYKGSDYDIVVTELNTTGTDIVASIKIGGGKPDGANIRTDHGTKENSLDQNYGDDGRSEVNLDAAGNIYLASCTQSSDFPTVGGFQTSNRGGGINQDGVVLKFTPDLSAVLFSSYLGGDGNDAAYVLSINPINNNIYVAGGTESNNNFPGSTAATIGPSNHGGIDGFISIISNDGSSILKSTFVGTSGVDQIYGLKFDRSGFPYIMGQTSRGDLWPALNAAWSQPGGQQFIAKLKPDLSAYVYKTQFGTGGSSPNISPVAFLVDRCENVYLSGWGGGARESFPDVGVVGLPVTPNAIKRNPDPGGGDFYFFVLKRDATSQLYGSFFGENSAIAFPDHVDGGTSRFDENGIIYQAICANCGHQAVFPTTPGAWSNVNRAPGPACNLAMVKIDFNLSGVRSGIQSSINGRPRDTAGCVPLTVDFQDTVQIAVSYEWNFGDGTPTVNSTSPNISHQFNSVGVYRVMLVAIDSTTCNLRDTSYLNIKVGNLQALLDFLPVKLNPCDSFKYRFDNLSLAPAAKPFLPTSFIWDFGDGSPKITTGAGSVFHNYVSPGTYNVQLILNDTSYCNNPDTLTKQLRIAALVKASFVVPDGCAPYNAVFNNTSQAGAQFIWDFGDGSTSTDVNPTHLYPTPGTYVVRLTAIDSATCNIIDSTSTTISVFGKPTPDFNASPQPPVVNTAITFSNLSSADAVKFKWLFGDGDSLITTSRKDIKYEYNSTGTFNACLIAANATGCADTICKQVRTIIEPLVDVPNAFTPGKGGANGVVYVRGFGIAKMTFTVWARWGEKVFETNDKSRGWDGTFGGKQLPMDVYAYTLQVQFSNGTKTTKTGDITLIR